MTENPGMMKQFSRFLVVSLGGLVIDLLLVRVVLLLTDYHISVAMTVGFIAGALVNYVLHESWTFKDKGAASRASVKRAFGYYVIVGVALGVRVISATVLDFLFGSPDTLWSIILVSVGLSFLTNFGLTRFVLFKDEKNDHA